MFDIIQVPALQDNYFWILHQPGQTDAYVIDPGDATPILEALEHHQLTLQAILITHRHWDHTDGIDELLQHNQVPVYGPDSSHIPQITHPLYDGDILELAPEWRATVWEIPGHTLDHIAYLFHPSDDAPRLFSGDTLFAAGCGRLFDGSAEQLHNALQRIAQLPADTGIYCAHEYTLANLAFAKAVEPNNTAISERLQRETKKREQGLATVPTSLGQELDTNPFLRTHIDSVRNAAEVHAHGSLATAADVFRVLRQWKDQF